MGHDGRRIWPRDDGWIGARHDGLVRSGSGEAPRAAPRCPRSSPSGKRQNTATRFTSIPRGQAEASSHALAFAQGPEDQDERRGLGGTAEPGGGRGRDAGNRAGLRLQISREPDSLCPSGKDCALGD